MVCWCVASLRTKADASWSLACRALQRIDVLVLYRQRCEAAAGMLSVM